MGFRILESLVESILDSNRDDTEHELYPIEVSILDTVLDMDGNEYAAAKRLNMPLRLLRYLLKRIESKMNKIALIESVRGL